MCFLPLFLYFIVRPCFYEYECHFALFCHLRLPKFTPFFRSITFFPSLLSHFTWCFFIFNSSWLWTSWLLVSFVFLDPTNIVAGLRGQRWREHTVYLPYYSHLPLVLYSSQKFFKPLHGRQWKLFKFYYDEIVWMTTKNNNPNTEECMDSHYRLTGSS